MMVMDFNIAEATMAHVSQQLLAAADRGVHIMFIVDAHSFVFVDGKGLSPYWYRGSLSTLPLGLAEKRDFIDELNRKPTASAVIINKFTHKLANPVAGRSHIKLTVIQDQVFIGGCNFQHVSWIDIMVGTKNPELADTLYAFVNDVAREQSTSAVLLGQDRQIPADNHTKLIIDAGVRNHSTILSTALNLIDDAQQSIYITCQYFPNSITARHLAAAHRRGVDVTVIYAHPSMQGWFGGLGQRASILLEKTRTPATLFKNGLAAEYPLHAKLLVTEQAAMVGSHNYVNAGVRLGTAEIALVTHDAELRKQALQTVQQQIPVRS